MTLYDPSAPEHFRFNNVTWEYEYAPQRPYDVGDTVTWTMRDGSVRSGMVTDVGIEDERPYFVAGDSWAWDEQLVSVCRA